MNIIKLSAAVLIVSASLTSCVGKKKYVKLQSDYDLKMTEMQQKFSMEEERRQSCEAKNDVVAKELSIREEQIEDLRGQVEEYKARYSKQVEQVGGLTVLSQSANDNIKETLAQLEQKDKYIKLLQAAKSKADSINLALAVNLKGELKDGIEDEDVNIKVDKTVVFINLSDKMLYKSGSYTLTPKANEVLAKIAKVIKSRPNFEVMVEGYTDNEPISKTCIRDNWDLSVLRSTSVVRELETKHGVDPNRLIAAGRGETNALTSNDTKEGKATNRRTRIIILPKLDQFYDLLDPENASK